MNNKKYLLGILMIMAQLCFGKTIHFQNDTVINKKKALYLVCISNNPPIATENYFVDLKSEDYMLPLQSLQSEELCKLFKIDFVFVVKLNPEAKILTLNDIFRIFKIEVKYRRFPVKIDDDLIDYPETILTSQNQIEDIKIAKDSKHSYIHIILKGYDELKKKYPHGGVFRPDD